MDAKEYKRWALDALRERARHRGIEVAGRKNEPQLLLARGKGLSITYYEDWWRSPFKRSGYGGAFFFKSEDDDPEIKPAIVLLINLGNFFISMRSPESLEQVDYFLDRLVQLASWCIEQKLGEFHALASEPGTALSKVERAGQMLREYPRLPDA